MPESEKPRYVSLSLMGVTSKQAHEAIDAALSKLGDVSYTVFYDDWDPENDEELECEACVLAIPHIHTLEEQGKKEEMLGKEVINNRFGFHKATIEGPEATAPKHADLREEFKSFANLLDHAIDDVRAKNYMMEALEVASMWAHKAIAETAPVVVDRGSNRDEQSDWERDAAIKHREEGFGPREGSR